MYNINISSVIEKYYINLPNDMCAVLVNNDKVYDYLIKSKTFFLHKEGRKTWKITKVKYFMDETLIPEKFISHSDTKCYMYMPDEVIVQSRNSILTSKLKIILP